MTSLVMWHASRADIERPTIAGRTVGTNHANSGLGLFCATSPHAYIARFGDTVHALTLKENPRPLTISVRELAVMGPRDMEDEDSRAWFEQEGRRLGQDFDMIEIMEGNGNIEQAIILNDSAIVSVARFSLADYQAICQPDPSPTDARPPRPSI